MWFVLWTPLIVYQVFNLKVFSKLPLEIGGQFTQTNKKQPHVLHFKNNIYYFIILTCILLFAYSSHFKLMIFTIWTFNLIIFSFQSNHYPTKIIKNKKYHRWELNQGTIWIIWLNHLTISSFMKWNGM